MGVGVGVGVGVGCSVGGGAGGISTGGAVVGAAQALSKRIPITRIGNSIRFILTSHMVLHTRTILCISSIECGVGSYPQEGEPSFGIVFSLYFFPPCAMCEHLL